MSRGVLPYALALTLLVLGSVAVSAKTIMLSANDGIETFSNGAYHITPGSVGGSLTALDLTTLPPRLLWKLPLDQTAVGPPTGVVVTPDGGLAIVSNPATRDPKNPEKRLDGKALQVFDLTANPVRPLPAVELDHHPWGIGIDPSGQHAMVADGDGTVTWLSIKGKQVSVLSVITLGPALLHTTSVAFSKDGRWALVAERGNTSVAALRIDGDNVTPVRNMTVGSNPYDVIVSPDGEYAAVSDIGNNSGDRASVTLIDLRTIPFRAVDVFSVGPTPEGIAFSPDSTKMAVNSIDGSNLKVANPFHTSRSYVQLFSLTGPFIKLLGAVHVGLNAQGLAFTPDGHTLIVQDFANDCLDLFKITSAGLVKYGPPVPMKEAPSALALFSSP
jgi:DNA-binding beta-propeller fold protein YncE